MNIYIMKFYSLRSISQIIYYLKYISSKMWLSQKLNHNLNPHKKWVGRRKETILGYIPKNDDEKNSGGFRLNILLISNISSDIYLYIPIVINAYTNCEIKLYEKEKNDYWSVVTVKYIEISHTHQRCWWCCN